MRLFIAFKLSKEQQHAVGVMQSRLKDYMKGVKWVRPENMHLTLKFLGETDSYNVGSIKAALEKAAITFDPFQYAFRGTGVFPHPGKPRVLWLGMQKGRKETAEIAEKVEYHLTEIGYAKEYRKFYPHLTLGRLRNQIDKQVLNRFLEEEKNFTTPLAEVDEIVLYQSILDSNGARYKEIFKSILQKR